MPLAVAYLVGGITLLWIGGDVLVRGAVGLAKTFGVGTLVIGLTVVAFGTSAPELAVNLLAAIAERGDLSFGNIIGSNIANIGLILGIGALIRPVAVHPSVVKRDIPCMLLATAVVVVMASDDLLDAHDRNVLSRGDGAVLLLMWAMYILVTIRAAVREPSSDDPLASETEQEVAALAPSRLWLAAIMTVGGIAGVAMGGHLTVNGATTIAKALGMSDAVIGLTIVAVGTSLPELATTIAAIRAGQTDLAVGNIVGSNIWNLLLILAVTTLVRPVDVPAGGEADLWMMAALAAAMLPLCMRGERRIGRASGGALLAAYAVFIAWRTLQAAP